MRDRSRHIAALVALGAQLTGVVLDVLHHQAPVPARQAAPAYAAYDCAERERPAGQAHACLVCLQNAQRIAVENPPCVLDRGAASPAPVPDPQTDTATAPGTLHPHKRGPPLS